MPCQRGYIAFFVRKTPSSVIYTLSLHDALPISTLTFSNARRVVSRYLAIFSAEKIARRSEEHKSELQSRVDLVCRLLLEKKKSKSCVTSFEPGNTSRCRASEGP